MSAEIAVVCFLVAVIGVGLLIEMMRNEHRFARYDELDRTRKHIEKRLDDLERRLREK